MTEDTKSSQADTANSKHCVSNVDLLDGLVTGPVPSLQPLGLLGGQPGLTPMFVVPQPGFISMPAATGVMQAGVEMVPGTSGMMPTGTGLLPVGVGATSIHPSQQQVLMGMSNVSSVNTTQMAGASFGGLSSVPAGLAQNPMMVKQLF